MTEHATLPPFWRPTQDGARLTLLWLGLAVVLIGAIALALSFVSVQDAARPYFGAAAWAIPVLMDTTLGVLTFFSITLELNGLRSPLARYASRVLVALTIYANVAPQHGAYGRTLHGAPPAVWVVVVTIAENAIRQLVGLSDQKRIEAPRKSLWLLRPLGTWRIWRRMRVEQITTYRAALDQDAARAAVVGRLRVSHGRMWRSKAPLAERIALRLQGRDPAGVALILTAHQETAALLAGTALATVPEPLESVPELPTEDASRDRPKPRQRRASGRGRKGAKTPAPRRSDDELFEAASALNAQVIEATGTPVSLRRLKADLRVGQPTAERLRHALAAVAVVDPFISQQAAPEPVLEAVPAASEDAATQSVHHANGSPV